VTLAATVPRPAAGPTLTVAGTSPSALALDWTQACTTGFSGYAIAESTAGSTGPWTTVGSVAAVATTTWSAGSLTPGSDAWWEVTASGFLCTSTSNVAGSVQPALANLTFTLPTGSSAEFNWTNNASYGGSLAFVSYGLFEQVGGGAPSLVASIPTSSTHSYTVTGLSGGLGYSFYLSTTDCYSACGTGSELLAVTSSNSVTFGVPVPLGVSVSAARTTIDTGQSDLFTCTASGGRSPYNFTWDFGNGTNVSGSLSESVSYATPGPESVTCEVTDGGHTTVASGIPITVDAMPQLQVTSNATAADVGQPVALGCTATNGTPTFAYAWNFGDGTTATVGAVSHAYAATGPEVATCTVTDATSTTVSANLPLTISPTLGVAASSSSATAAPGTTLDLVAAATNGSGSFSAYAWTFGDGGHGTGSSVTHAYAGAGTFTASVRVTDSNGATNRSSVTVTVSPISIRLASLPATARTGQTLTFNASASGGAGGPYNVSWAFGDGTTGYGAVVTHRYATAGTYEPSVVVTDRLGATNTSTTTTLAVSVPPPPPPLVPLWALLLLIVLVLALVLAVGYREFRRRRSAALRAAAPWAPPTDPSRTLLGRKNCVTCGHANLPIRETCENCGADLPRRLQHS
jgi:PKD repeat protein